MSNIRATTTLYVKPAVYWDLMRESVEREVLIEQVIAERLERTLPKAEKVEPVEFPDLPETTSDEWCYSDCEPDPCGCL